jgi:hypothetical protein
MKLILAVIAFALLVALAFAGGKAGDIHCAPDFVDDQPDEDSATNDALADCRQKAKVAGQPVESFSVSWFHSNPAPGKLKYYCCLSSEK